MGLKIFQDGFLDKGELGIGEFAHAVTKPSGVKIADFTKKRRRRFPVELNQVVIVSVFDARGEGNPDKCIVAFSSG